MQDAMRGWTGGWPNRYAPSIGLALVGKLV